jgi:hypothetical protein
LIDTISDGELSLYPDVDESGLRSEVTLQAANDLWMERAATLTAGAFHSVDPRTDDRVVTWKDGEVTLYSDVDASGLHREIQLQAPNNTWTNAKECTARRPSSGRRTDTSGLTGNQRANGRPTPVATMRLIHGDPAAVEQLLACLGRDAGPTGHLDLEYSDASNPVLGVVGDSSRRVGRWGSGIWAGPG